MPVPGGPIKRTPLGILPPSFWNFWGSFRNSMISCSSTLASSTPATSLKVTFFCVGVSSLARDLPKERALFPPACICRMITNQIATRRINGPYMTRAETRDESLIGVASISTPLASRSSTSFG